MYGTYFIKSNYCNNTNGNDKQKVEKPKTYEV